MYNIIEFKCLKSAYKYLFNRFILMELFHAHCSSESLSTRMIPLLQIFDLFYIERIILCCSVGSINNYYLSIIILITIFYR